MKQVFLILGCVAFCILAFAGVRGMTSARPPIELFSDMVRQPRYNPEVPGHFFADGRAARPPVAGTVPIGYRAPSASQTTDLEFASGTSYRSTGKFGSSWGNGIPEDVTVKFLRRGQDRFTIYCAVCHGATGLGNGITTKFGLITVANLLQPRLREMADGEIFNTLSAGKNSMLGYADRIPLSDRWAIVAYLRALQKSQGGATLRDVPPEEKPILECVR